MTGGSAIEPYRVLFPIGVAYAIAGVAVWPLFIAGRIPYPGPFHGLWMIGGFLVAFAAGFLMTAVPKFTGTDPCSRLELAIAAALLMGGWVSFDFVPVLLLFLLAFFARRFLRREYSPPPHFIFVGLGLFCGIVGSAGIALASAGLSLPLLPFRVLFLQGLMLCLLIGVGARLLRVLLGFAPSPLVQIQSSVRSRDRDRLAAFRAEAKPAIRAAFLALSVGFALEFAPGLEIVGRALRGAVVLWVALAAWRLHRLPRGKGVLAWGIWASCGTFVVGALAYPFAGVYSVHLLHLIFVGGFGVTTLLVASRVLLAHGGHPVEIETRSRLLAWVCGLGVFASLARAGAGFSSGEGYVRHLLFASIAWLAAVALWAGWMGRKLAT